MNTEELEDMGFKETDETCEKCGDGKIYKKEINEGGGNELKIVHFTCSNNTKPNGGSSCYYEEKALCPDCDGELTGDSSGPDRYTGARSGIVECTECDFKMHWSE